MSTVQEFDFSLDLLTSILWSYNDAVNLQGLTQLKQNWYDENQTAFWNDWIVDVFDMRTANAFGLSVWSVILDLPLFGESDESPPGYPAWGFGPTYGHNFFDGNFATDAKGVFGIPLEQKRLLLQLRYYQLTTRGATPAVNRFLNTLFGPNQIYAFDVLDMTINYVLVGNTAISMQSLFELFDILPRPAGVLVNFVITDFETFGFADFGLNFTNGSFGA